MRLRVWKYNGDRVYNSYLCLVECVCNARYRTSIPCAQRREQRERESERADVFRLYRFVFPRGEANDEIYHGHIYNAVRIPVSAIAIRYRYLRILHCYRENWKNGNFDENIILYAKFIKIQLWFSLNLPSDLKLRILYFS